MNFMDNREMVFFYLERQWERYYPTLGGFVAVCITMPVGFAPHPLMDIPFVLIISLVVGLYGMLERATTRGIEKEHMKFFRAISKTKAWLGILAMHKRNRVNLRTTFVLAGAVCITSYLPLPLLLCILQAAWMLVVITALLGLQQILFIYGCVAKKV